MSKESNNYYIYLYIDPRTEEPFYIGKGCGKRYLDYENGHNKDVNLFVEDLKQLELLPIVLVYDCESQEEAFTEEQLLIQMFGRKNVGSGSLLNRSYGGEGSGGRIVSEQTKHKMSLSKQGANNSMYGVIRSGELNPHYGRKHSAETKTLISKVLSGRNLSDEHKQNITRSMRKLHDKI